MKHKIESKLCCINHITHIMELRRLSQLTLFRPINGYRPYRRPWWLKTKPPRWSETSKLFTGRHSVTPLTEPQIYHQFTSLHLSWDGAVNILTRIGAGRSGVRILSETRELLHLRWVQIGSGAHPASSSLEWEGYFPGARATTFETNISSRNAEVKNRWRYTSTSPHASMASCWTKQIRHHSQHISGPVTVYNLSVITSVGTSLC